MSNPNMLFNGGIPTAPDVQRIMERTGDLQTGDCVTYEQIEQAINEKKSSNRFRSVVTSWKNKMFRENNQVLEAVANVGYKVLDGSERVDFSGRKVKQGFRRIRKGAVVARQTRREGLTACQAKALDHIGSIDATIRLAERTKAKPLEIPEPEKVKA